MSMQASPVIDQRADDAHLSFVRLALLLLCIRCALKLMGLQKTYRRMSKLIARAPSREPPTAEYRKQAFDRVAIVAALFPGRALCLEQSLLLWFSLRRRGIQAV